MYFSRPKIKQNKCLQSLFTNICPVLAEIIHHYLYQSWWAKFSSYKKEPDPWLHFCFYLLQVSCLWQKIMSIKPIDLCFHWGFVLSSFKFCHRLCCDWGKCTVLLQTRIHRNTVRKVGASPPSLPFPTTQPAGEGELCRQAAAGARAVGKVLPSHSSELGAGLLLSLRLEQGLLGKIQDGSVNKSLTSFSFPFCTCLRNLRRKSNLL